MQFWFRFSLSLDYRLRAYLFHCSLARPTTNDVVPRQNEVIIGDIETLSSSHVYIDYNKHIFNLQHDDNNDEINSGKRSRCIGNISGFARELLLLLHKLLDTN